jgi:hypothetical protein
MYLASEGGRKSARDDGMDGVVQRLLGKEMSARQWRWGGSVEACFAVS